MNGLVKAMITSLEALDGIPTEEIEYTLYGKLQSMEILQKAHSKERQQQCSIPFQKEGTRLRVRMVDDQTCSAALKSPRPDGHGVTEIEFELTRPAFDEFLKVGENVYYKDRYCFPVGNTGLKYEVDVFVKADGSYSPWVKIDLEVPSADTPMPEMPFDVEELINTNEPMDDEQRAQVDALWQEEWLVGERK